MFQTMPSMPVLALVMPAVSGCITRELPGWSVALSCPYSDVRTSAARSDANGNHKDRARHSTTKDPSPKPDQTAPASRIVLSPRHASCRRIDPKRPSHRTGFESTLSTTFIDRGSPDWADDPFYSRQTLTGD